VGAGLDGACRRPLRGYRALRLKRNYPRAAIDYAPVVSASFVLSGTLDGRIFYERVTFPGQAAHQ